MCGIAGDLRLDGTKVDEKTLIRMRDTMIHRGPDGAGAWMSETGQVGFGHRRLSIIDLSDLALQPMPSIDGSVCITFNGEIYNHQELRQELIKCGRRQWKTDHSDTEVLIQAYQQWGDAFLGRLRGMFAFAIWDDKRKRLLLARDRIGIKPLYYRSDAHGFTFASEIKAILAHPQSKRAVDEEALFHYLSFLTTPSPQTLFAGIKKVVPGTYLTIEAGGRLEEKRYWELWENIPDLSRASEDEIASKLLAELRESVRLHKAADVPVGVFLSGGIDSSLNTALFADGESQPVNTFSIGYSGQLNDHENEFRYARMMANRVGAKHHERELTQQDLLSFLPEMIRLQDEPIADPVCVPVFYVSKLARDAGMKVCQVGEGSDELFWGYPSWKSHLQLEHLHGDIWPSPLKAVTLKALQAGGYGESFRFEALRRSFSGQIPFWSGAEAFTGPQKQRLLSRRMAQRFAGLTSFEAIRPIRERFEQKAPQPDPLKWMSYIDLNLRLPELLLMRVDKMGMGVSLESRVPFLDHKIVEYAMGIPTAIKTKNGVLKSILKKAVRGVIPDELIDRKKQGFSVPLHDWFQQELGERMRSEVLAFCQETNYLDAGECEALMAQGRSLQMWFLFNLALWWRHNFR